MVAAHPKLDAAAVARALTCMGEQAAIVLLGRQATGTPGDVVDLLAPVWSMTLFGR